MNIEIKLSGHMVCTDLVNNRLIKQVYIGYSKAEAKRKFKKYIKLLNKILGILRKHRLVASPNQIALIAHDVLGLKLTSQEIVEISNSL